MDDHRAYVLANRNTAIYCHINSIYCPINSEKAKHSKRSRERHSGEKIMNPSLLKVGDLS